MRVGILGGSFDPVHKGHIKLGLAARRQLKLDVVYFVLSPQSPFKLTRKPTPFNHRYRMLKQALKPHALLRAVPWEKSAKGPAYTVTTLSWYKQNHPRHHLFFIMGSDAFKGFGRWKSPDMIARLATLVIGRRPGSASFRIPDKWKRLTRILDGRFPTLSSNEIRRQAKSNPTKSLLKQLPLPVVHYIRKNDLYE